ncbi:iron-siderophore ABC transporter substrate-binding protein [Aneurinibacillus thermoaerophilus]|uniref:ABC transporter substrate-binding protein n=1 Tax=Aneurinibacillus thermoaerophilus TaxID=143495 RepID=UPI002E1BD4BB|nr:iron-siderophore ABC transporter substrate-binding protein [Aneurinibacillus thermoaerophilus]MED0764862.1 iron-siderophore ABC transporter substrate-binding protein [Aneurinibacillus thermoaerophilus]
MARKKRSYYFLCIWLIAIVLLMTACGGQTASAPEKAESSGSSEQVIKHAMGETKLKKKPERVVTLDNGALDNVLALGVKPVGAATVFADHPFPSYLKGVEGIEKVGTINQPNLETIAALQPDLILGSKDTHEAIYEKLSQIAPTVFVETLGATWKENLKLQAEALGKTKEAEKLLNDYNNRIEEFKVKMGDRLTKTHVSILRPRKDNVTVYLRDNFSGSIIQDAGLPRPAAQDKNEFSVKLNEERVADMEGDAIFWFTRDEENLLTSKIMSNPTWKQFKAVKENKVYRVSDETWLSGLGYQAANRVVDDLFANLAK